MLLYHINKAIESRENQPSATADDVFTPAEIDDILDRLRKELMGPETSDAGRTEGEPIANEE